MKNGVSVIIPTFNRQEFISRAIRSVINQKYSGAKEIIVSDDGSTDRTVEIARSFGPEIVVVTKPTCNLSQGVSATRNRGLLIAKYPLVCFLDSDDFYLPGHLDKLSSPLIADKRLDFSFCRMLEVREHNGKEICKPWTHLRVDENDVRNPGVSRGGIIHTNCIMLRHQVFTIVGTFNETISNGEDIDMWMRVSERFKGAFVDHYGAVYRTHHSGGQLTQRDPRDIDSDILKVIDQALGRYDTLKLSDPRRIFELKHLKLHRLFGSQKPLYYLKYWKLISSHPDGFLKRIPTVFSQVLEKPAKNKWSTLQDPSNFN